MYYSLKNIFICFLRNKSKIVLRYQINFLTKTMNFCDTTMRYEIMLKNCVKKVRTVSHRIDCIAFDSVIVI